MTSQIQPSGRPSPEGEVTAGLNAELSVACRRCAQCEGEEHHWMYAGEEDEAGEPVMSCKHCEATRPVEDAE